MTTILLASLGLLVAFLVCPLVWLCRFAPRVDPMDRAALAPVVAILLFAASSGIAQFTSWSFRVQAVATFVVLAAGLLWLLVRSVRDEFVRCLGRAWVLLVPAACCFLAVAAFGVVQGDPPATLAYPRTLVSARVGNLPPDHLFPVGAAQILQHRTDPMTRGFFGPWDFADRTPLAGAVAASAASAIGGNLPTRPIWTLAPDKIEPAVHDTLGYWQTHLVLVLLNTLVVVAIARLALSIYGDRAALIAGFLAATNPFVFTNSFFTWPKMLAAYFVLLHYTYVRERRSAILSGGTAGLAYLSHPLSLLFVLPSLVKSIGRARAPKFGTLGAFVLTLVPWQIWSTLYAHPSRMLTYPLGYTMRNPDNLGDEVSTAFEQFRDHGLGRALRIRWDTVLDTVSPFNPVRNYLTLPDRHLSASEAWFTVHDRTIGGIVLFVLVPAVIVGVVLWHRRARFEWVWMLAAPLVLAVLFWGIDPQGLGAALLQPTGAVLVVLAAGGLCAFVAPLRIAVALLAIAEAASVVWWGLFARSGRASTVDVVVAVALWALPALLLAAVVVGRPRGRSSAPEPELSVASR